MENNNNQQVQPEQKNKNQDIGFFWGLVLCLSALAGPFSLAMFAGAGLVQGLPGCGLICIFGSISVIELIAIQAQWGTAVAGYVLLAAVAVGFITMLYTNFTKKKDN